MTDKTQMLANMTPRQKATALLVVAVIAFLFYQVYGMFGGSSESVPANAAATAPTPPPAPQVAQLVKEPPMTDREKELMRMQQETQAKYVATLNELQMLRLSLQIAETTKAIMVAKLDTVTAQKGIVDLLAPPTAAPTPETYAQGLEGKSGSNIVPVSSVTPSTTAAQSSSATGSQEISITVVSVSKINNKWNAVLGAGGSLYSVTMGDVLPDGSTVLSIDKSGIILDKNGQQKKVSLVPII